MFGYRKQFRLDMLKGEGTRVQIDVAIEFYQSWGGLTITPIISFTAGLKMFLRHVALWEFINLEDCNL